MLRPQWINDTCYLFQFFPFHLTHFHSAHFLTPARFISECQRLWSNCVILLPVSLLFFSLTQLHLALQIQPANHNGSSCQLSPCCTPLAHPNNQLNAGKKTDEKTLCCHNHLYLFLKFNFAKCETKFNFQLACFCQFTLFTVTVTLIALTFYRHNFMVNWIQMPFHLLQPFRSNGKWC